MASNTEQQTQTNNALGEKISFTDENLTTHTLVYDALGRLYSDTATVLGAGVDGAIRQVRTTYNSQGLPKRITTYSDTAGTTIVSQIMRWYNQLGQLTNEWQSDNGPVNTTTTPKVSYQYSEMTVGAIHNWLTKEFYPDGRNSEMLYNSSVIDDPISRLSRQIDSASGSFEYSYFLGLNNIVHHWLHRGGIVRSTFALAGDAVQIGDSGDGYVGLDRFNRLVATRWHRLNATMFDYRQYVYDRNGNRLYTLNLLSPSSSELYAYDNLNRLVTMQRGTLNATNTALIGASTRAQSWNLDALVNSSSVTTDGVVENRTHNRQNELTQLGTTNLAFDSNGNMTIDQNGKTIIYDAWNRVVEQKNGATSEVIYRYDGVGRRIREGNRAEFYNNQWQAVEERITATNAIAAHYHWSIIFVDAMILRRYNRKLCHHRALFRFAVRLRLCTKTRIQKRH